MSGGTQEFPRRRIASILKGLDLEAKGKGLDLAGFFSRNTVARILKETDSFAQRD